MKVYDACASLLTGGEVGHSEDLQFPMNPHEFNPYAAPAGTHFQPPLPPPADSAAVTVFAAINLVLAFGALAWTGFIACAMVYGIYYSGDEGDELVAGVVGSMCLGLPGVIGLVLFPVASLGLFRRRPWGYFFHIVGAALAALSCVGIVYTVIALIFAARTDFRNSFNRT